MEQFNWKAHVGLPNSDNCDLLTAKFRDFSVK
jgi:hypothetical protein